MTVYHIISLKFAPGTPAEKIVEVGSLTPSG